MLNRVIKVLDMAVCVLWCVYFIIRIHYPKIYPPLNLYDVLLILLFIIDNIIIRIKRVYDWFEKDKLVLVIRICIILIPIAYAVVYIV